MRRFTDSKLVIATHNPGKVREFRDLLGSRVPEIVSAGELGLPEPEEPGETFLENAIIKARAAAKASGHVALADDSGLCVAALGDKPGLHSARWAGPERDFGKAVQRIHDELGANTDSSAYFLCVLALVWPDGHAETVEGRCNGKIIWKPRGNKGHDYDPWFVPEGHDRTFAEMDAAEKNALSHRGKALRALVKNYLSS
jgi:XTP/dITP diphosphohydrolase